MNCKINNNRDTVEIVINYEGAYVSGIYDKNTEELGILDLYVPGRIRGRGIGTNLVKSIVKKCYDNYNLKIITLDDMSDRHREKNNIYTKMGFYYCDYWGPEMSIRSSRFMRFNNLL
jgi:GNAT superfamily N-acetyltransferase